MTSTCAARRVLWTFVSAFLAVGLVGTVAASAHTPKTKTHHTAHSATPKHKKHHATPKRKKHATPKSKKHHANPTHKKHHATPKHKGHHTKHIHKTAPHHKIVVKPQTSCPTIGKVADQSVWFDRHGSQANELSRLICTAADHSIVLVKMYFVIDDAGPAAQFLHDVSLMHRYHHVSFRFLMEAHQHGAQAVSLRQDERATPGTEWFECHNSCGSTRHNAISHSKFIVISKLSTTHRPALLTTSTNISYEQLVLTIQSGILFTDDAPLYDRFVREFATYRSCAEGDACNKVETATTWTQYGSVAVYFDPDLTDPIAADLRQLDCTQGGTIELASLMLDSYSMIRALTKDQSAGCVIKVLVEHPQDDPSAAVQFGARTELQHDKYLIIDTPTTHMLYEGTQDFSPSALHHNDNYMIRTANSDVYRAYQEEFAYQWSRSVSSSSSRARAISGSAASRVGG